MLLLHHPLSCSAGISQGQPVSPKRSGSQVSLAFDALVMAATGGTEGAAAAAGGGEAPVESRLGGPLAAAGLTPGSGSLGAAAAAAAAAMAASVGRSTGAGVHQLPSRQRSRLWSALSYGDVDSLQNALDAFRVSRKLATDTSAAGCPWLTVMSLLQLGIGCCCS